MIYEFRQYQEDSYNAVKQAFVDGYKKVFLSAPTGSGKSHIGLRIIKEALAKGKRVAFLVDRINLMDQFAKMACDEGIKDFSLMQSDNPFYNKFCNFQIITAQTLGRRTVEPFDLVLYDESHIIYKSIITKMKEWKKTYWVGLSATPFTKGLGKIWETLVCGTSTKELIDKGYLSNYIAYGPSKPDLKGIRTSAGDYNKKDLAERTDKKQLIGDIIEHWLRLANDRKTVVGAVNVAHAEHIAEAFKNEKVKADVIHCYQDPEEIRNKLEMFKCGDLQVLSSVDLISRGADMPDVNCLVVARPTKSLNYHLQFLGRGLRKCDGKENCLILDHSGNINRLGFPDDEHEMVLHMGEKDLKDRDKKEKKVKLPSPCPKCFYMRAAGENVCKSCGHETKKQPNVDVKEGTLEELQKGRMKKATPESKENFYSKLIAAAKAAGFNPGWAAYKYREYYGVWPAKKLEADQQFYDWLSSQPRWKIMKVVFGLVR